MAKQVLFDTDGEKKIREGMETLADCVRITLGPTGKNIIYKKGFDDEPTASGDATSIADEVELEDPFENMGASLLNEIAENVNDEAGDGAGTGILLGETIYRKGLRFVAADANPMKLRTGIEKAANAAVDHVREQARDIDADDEALRDVATIAANGDEEKGERIAEAVREVGSEGIISVEEGTGIESRLTLVDGLNFDKGYMSPHFCTDKENMIAEFEDAYILLYEDSLNQVKPLLKILEQVAQRGKPLLIVAEDVEGEALTALVLNRLRGTLKSCAVKAPAFGDRRKSILEDIAVLTDGQVVSEEKGLDLESLTLDHLGEAGRIRVDEDETVITDGKGSEEQIDKRIEQIRNKMEKPSTSDYDREKLEKRLAKLQGGVARIEAGGASESEIAENCEIYQDGVNSAQEALRSGVVPGGGAAFIRAREAVENLDLEDDEELGASVVIEALEEPLRQIASNAGMAGSVAVEEVAEADEDTGFNARTGELEDLFEAGVLDAAEVAVTALENAASLSGTILTSRAFLTDLDAKEDAVEGSMN